MRTILHLIPLAVLIPCAASAQAAEPAPPATIAPSEGIIAADRTVALTAGDNDLRSGVVPSSALTLVASNDASEVALTLSSNRDGELKANGQTLWSLVLKAPLDKDTGSGTFVTEQGLTSQFVAEFGFTHVFASLGVVEENAAQAIAKYHNACEAAATGKPEYATLTAGPGGSPTLRRQQRKFVRDFCKLAGDVEGLERKQLLLYLTPDEVDAVKNDEIAQGRKPIGFINLTGSLGYREFSFLSPVDFSEHEESKVSYSFALSGGVHFGRNAPFLGGGYEYTREYKAGDKKVLCPVPQPATPTECRNEIFAAPTADVSHTVFGLVRFANLYPGKSERSFNSPFAIEVKAAYDFHDDIFGVSVPIYMFLNADRELRGGVKFSWANRTTDSRDDEFKFGVFIAKSFDFLGL